MMILRTRRHRQALIQLRAAERDDLQAWNLFPRQLTRTDRDVTTLFTKRCVSESNRGGCLFAAGWCVKPLQVYSVWSDGDVCELKLFRQQCGDPLCGRDLRH